MRFELVTRRLGLFGCLIGLFAIVLITACVPSPTATPPRQTPFPTLPVGEGTPTAEFLPTDLIGTPALPNGGTPEATLPAPTLSANAARNADTLAPIVQLTVQDVELPVSLEQPVPLNVLAADNNVIARLEVYDNNMLYAQAPVIVSASVYSNQFLWKPTVIGKHTLRAIAYDGSDNSSEAAQVEMNVITNNRGPNVIITAPAGIKDAELGAPMLIQGVATDDVAVTRMDLIVDNQLVTFVKPDREGGVTPLAVAIPWTPTTTGTHNVVLRAYDNQNQSDDSLRFTIRVFDNQAPVVTAQADAPTIARGDVFVVNTLALSNNGVGRIELYVDERLTDAATSKTPSQQTYLQAALSAADLEPGTHTYFVRAHDTSGTTTDTARATIEVKESATHVLRETRVAANTRTPLPPIPTATPELKIPPAPTLELKLTKSPVVLPDPARIEITALGSAELSRLEIWVRAPGEATAQLVTEENLQGSTERTLTYDWTAPRAGVVEMYARVTDNLGQQRVSVPLRISVLAPPPPTARPSGLNFAQTWYAESPAARYQATFVQIGHALRGTFIEQRADGKVLGGKIVSGAVNDKNAIFGVDFAGDANEPQHILDMECTYVARPPVITCNYTNENGERGSAVFQPLEP